MSIIKVTDNEKLRNAILDKLSKDRHCPCRSEKTDDTLCMCKEFREMKEGACHCGLYEKIPADGNASDREEMTVYDMKKEIISQIKDPVNDIKEDFVEVIRNSFTSWGNACFMCREKYDFTILYDIKEYNSISVLKEIILNRGILYDYDINEDGSIDFWINTFDDNKIHMYKMFDGTEMIVSCKE